MVNVELIYIPSDGKQVHLPIVCKEGTTISDGIEMSRIYETHPETKELPFGIFGKQVPKDTVLKEGDRVEIYRHLTIDPKDKRRNLAKKR